MTFKESWTTLLAATLSVCAHAQEACVHGGSISGAVSDPTGAVIPGAVITTSNGLHTTSDSLGQYNFPCIPSESITVHAEMHGFSARNVRIKFEAGRTVHSDIQLSLSQVQERVQVNGDNNNDPGRGVGITTLDRRQVQQLADDPDDLLRQLQVLAASSGGMPGLAAITVDGFQNTSALPPKSSIASIQVNPDMFSPQYEAAPYLGGRVEIFTNPGVSSFHGALFYTDSEGSFNATDPFSVAATPASKRRYGFELSGPIMRKRSSFALALERRSINEFNIVNALTLDSSGDQTPLQQTVAAPQSLWIASGRSDWQASHNDVASISYSANVNNSANQGVGGLISQEGGYSILVGEYDLRFSNVQTLSPDLLHQTHVGYTWQRTQHAPNSSSPSIQVAGYFTSGGDTAQALNDRERNLEVDDDWLLTREKHSISIGVQSLGAFIHDYDPSTFNGAYVFGGGTAPVLDTSNNPTGQTEGITALEQYRRALLRLPGGDPTTYQITVGKPVVPLTQWRFALYAGDSIKLLPRLTITGGLRYQFQTTPVSAVNFAPRASISWSVDKKATWTVHARAGLFHDPNLPAFATEVYRLDGIRQQETTVYNPSYYSPLLLNSSSIAVGAVNRFPSSLDQVSSLQTHIGLDHTLPKGWHAASVLYWAENWGSIRIRNVNAPLIASSNDVSFNLTTALSAPRPFAPNENIFEYQNSGHLSGNILVAGADHSSGGRFGFAAYYVHTALTTNTADGHTPISPQSSYSDRGEASRPDGEVSHAVYANGTIHFPYKVDFSSILDAENGHPYNVITGTDNNGDGDFNDRPSYAPAPRSGVYDTQFGLLSTNVVNGEVPRNLGTMPPRIHLDGNLSRVFTLNPRDHDHPRTLTVNARSANIINHTNVTTVGNVVSSSTFSRPLAAETARRLELGLRFAF